MIGLLALVTASIFFGAAVFVSFAEHPARLLLDDPHALAEWKPSYRRGAQMQATLAAVSGLLGLAAWEFDGNALWGAGALAMLANWPYTLLAIMPVNRRLEAIPPASAPPETRGLLLRWGQLHAGRSALGAIATLLYLDAASRLI